MKVFSPLAQLWQSAVAVVSSFFADEYEQSDRELSALEEAFVREVLPEVLGAKK